MIGSCSTFICRPSSRADPKFGSASDESPKSVHLLALAEKTWLPFIELSNILKIGSLICRAVTHANCKVQQGMVFWDRSHCKVANKQSVPLLYRRRFADNRAQRSVECIGISGFYALLSVIKHNVVLLLLIFKSS